MLDFVKVWFSSVWKLFETSWPGFDFSIGVVFIAVALAVVALKVIFQLFDVSLGSTVSSTVGKATSIAASRRSDRKDK